MWRAGEKEIDSATLILPIVDMPRIPLLDLNITVAGQDVYRIPLDESARIQAKYVSYLAKCANLTNGRPLREDLVDLLTAIFYFPSNPFEKVWMKYNRFSLDTGLEWLAKNYIDVQSVYLAEQEFPFRVGRFYSDWKKVADKIRTLADNYVISEVTNSAERPLIAIPYFFQEMRHRSLERYENFRGEHITHLLEELHSLLEAANGVADQRPAANEFISAYFGYGLRWMAFARCTVPLDRPFTITVRQKRAVYFRKTRDVCRPMWGNFCKTAWTTIAFADAETNHVSIRTSDTAVRLKHWPKVRGENDKPLYGSGRYGVDEEESTFELYLRQDSTRGRKKRILIGVSLRLTKLHSSMLWLAIAITGFGIGLLAWRGVVEFRTLTTPVRTYGLTAKDAAVILIPSTFAASLLLARDSSTLSARIRRARQAFLTLELFSLLAMAFFLFLLHYIRPDVSFK
ncbi:hypothetical protein [Streptomyces sp. P5_D11]